MHWEDEGILIGIKKFGENDQIASFMTKEHGLSKGLIKGGLSKKQRPYLQQGNFFKIIWKSRLEEQLGFFNFESEKIFGTKFYNNEVKLKIIISICSLIYDSLAEKQKYEKIYNTTKELIMNIEAEEKEKMLLYEYLLWEENLLKEIGFGLSLNKCIATGSEKNLIYISPKSGHAISETAGEKYKTKLLKMPKIWKEKLNYEEITEKDIKECLKILSYFFEKHIYTEKNKPFPYIRKGLEK